MELSDLQKDLLAALTERGLPREDVFSVMLVLTKEEKTRAMLTFLRENGDLDADAIREKAGEIAFGDES